MSESDCSHDVTVDAGMLGLKGGVGYWNYIL